MLALRRSKGSSFVSSLSSSRPQRSPTSSLLLLLLLLLTPRCLLRLLLLPLLLTAAREAELDVSGLVFSSMTPALPAPPLSDGDWVCEGDAKVGRFTGEKSGVCLLLGGDWNSDGEGEAPLAIGVEVAAPLLPVRRLPMAPALGLRPGL